MAQISPLKGAELLSDTTPPSDARTLAPTRAAEKWVMRDDDPLIKYPASTFRLSPPARKFEEWGCHECCYHCHDNHHGKKSGSYDSSLQADV